MDIEKMQKQLGDAIDNNQKDSPAMTIDPATNKLSVVGNPNNTHPTSGKYKVTYEYYPEEVAEEDKHNFKHIVDKKNGIDKYLLTVTYENRRVKPLYRTQVVTILLGVLGDLNVLTEDGHYTSEQLSDAGKVFIDHTSDMMELARIVLDEKPERLEHATELITFMTQLLENEPNIINEVTNFLASLDTASLTKLAKVQKTNTTQG